MWGPEISPISQNNGDPLGKNYVLATSLYGIIPSPIQGTFTFFNPDPSSTDSTIKFPGISGPKAGNPNKHLEASTHGITALLVLLEIMSGVPQEYVLRSILFNIVIII